MGPETEKENSITGGLTGMKKIMTAMVSLALACMLLTSCANAGTAGTGSAVSGGAVKGNVQVSKYRQDGHRYQNDDYTYLAPKYGGTLLQEDNDDDSDRYTATVEMDITSVQWVANEWLYYTTEGDHEEDILWRAPIVKTKKGEHIKKNKREKLIRKYSLDIRCATETCLILEVMDREGATSIVRYDLDRGSCTELVNSKEIKDLCVLTDDMNDPALVADGLLVESGKKLIRLDLDTGEVTEIFTLHEPKEDGVEAFVYQGDQVWFLENNSLYCYDGNLGKVSCLVTESDFAKAVQRSGGNKRVKSWDEIYLDQENLYFICQIKEMRKQGTGKKAVYYRTELYHAPREDPQQISREDILLDYLDKVGYEEDSDDGSFEELGWIEDIRDGKAIAVCPAESGSAVRIYYDLKTKEITKR